MSIILNKETHYSFATFYKFTAIRELNELKSDIYAKAAELDIIGLVLLAGEGLNATVCGDNNNLANFITYLTSVPGLEDMNIKYSEAELKRLPFRKMKVKIKAEIVTMGIDNIDPVTQAGTYVEPEDWNNLIQDPDVLLIDTRNVYEYRIGTFRGARDPKTLNFRQFPAMVEKILGEEKPKKVAMFCTGGIRCEKATAFVKQLGVENVFHLHGGILKYFEDIPQEESLWDGKCFVFDGRITVDQDLHAKPEPLCSVCGQVMTKLPDSEKYECHQCIEYPIHKKSAV